MLVYRTRLRYGRDMNQELVPSELERGELTHLITDKYAGNASLVTQEDKDRLASGEPLAYIIGWIPFLGLRVHLDTHPLIPRPETEWWTEQLIAHLKEKYADKPFTFLDLCAGSGAIGLAILKNFPHARVSFGEIVSEHAQLIQKNIEINDLDAYRADIATGDLFAPFSDTAFDIVATNPPYIPQDRVLERSVSAFEPGTALYAGPDGLTTIRVIAKDAKKHMKEGGELWMEADIENVKRAGELLAHQGALLTLIQNDHYARPRVVIAYY